MDYDVLIIGSGPAGLTAGLYAGRAGKKVAIVEGMLKGGAITLTEKVENFSGISAIDGFSLTMEMYKQAESFGVQFFEGEVKSLNLKEDIKSAILDDGKTLTANNVILAMGTLKRKMGIPNEDNLVGQGISYCATCDGNFFRRKNVVVYGGGDTAITDALYLAKIANEITVVHRRDEFRASNILVKRMNQTPNIKVITNSVITELVGEPLNKVVIKNTLSGGISEIEASGLFVAIGTIPNTALVKSQVELDDYGYIKTDAHMRTNLNGVFAIGDIRVTPLRQIITACADGAVAAESLD